MGNAASAVREVVPAHPAGDKGPTGSIAQPQLQPQVQVQAQPIHSRTHLRHHVQSGQQHHYVPGGGEPGLGRKASAESMPESPGAATRSPLLFTPQIGTAPITRAVGELSYYPGVYDGQGDEEQKRFQQGVPTLIVWSHGGKSVSVEGSWDNWTSRQPLELSGKDFTLLKVLPSGVYQYKFIVDGEWRYAPDQPAVCDEMGNVNNVLDIHEYVPENLDNMCWFDPPKSPVSSYTSPFTTEESSKEPPLLPDHLHLTLLNVPPGVDSPAALPRPQHVVLNHVYVEKAKASKSVLSLGVTHRFRTKYVTVLLYKPLQK